jgi:hypothetical protein
LVLAHYSPDTSDGGIRSTVPSSRMRSREI